MADFKKDSLIENYNRIVKAKNQRLNENGRLMFGQGFVSENEGEEVSKENIVDYIIRFEGGELGTAETLQLFSYLIKTGMAWSLQGSYGRAAKSLIDQGYIDQQGNIQNMPDDEY